MNDLAKVKSKQLLTDEMIVRNIEKRGGNEIEKEGQSIGLLLGIRKAALR